MDTKNIKDRLAAAGIDLQTLGTAADLVPNTEPIKSDNPALQNLINQLNQVEQNERYILVTQGIDATVAELNQLKSDMLASAPGIAVGVPVGSAPVAAAGAPVSSAPAASEGPTPPTSPAVPAASPEAPAAPTASPEAPVAPVVPQG